MRVILLALSLIFCFISYGYTEEIQTASTQGLTLKEEKLQVISQPQSFNNIKIESGTINIKQQPDTTSPKIAAVNIKATKKVKALKLQAQPKDIDKTNWRKGSFSLPVSQSSTPVLKATQSKELQKLEQQRKQRKANFEKELSTRPARKILLQKQPEEE